MGKKKIIPRAACILAIFAMGICGYLYKSVSCRLEQSIGTPVALPVPLKAFPLAIGGWVGKELRLDENEVRVAKNDDFCSRLYLGKNANYWANVYIAYSARPRTMIGHRPDMCYVGAGWIRDNPAEKSEFLSRSGKQIPCLIHYFHMPEPKRSELVVLNFYIINGSISNDENSFSGLEWRTPNIDGNPARYVAQIQISSESESMVRAAAADIGDTVIDFFPDKSGVVKALGYIGQYN